MKRYVCFAWHYWCSLWQLNWDYSSGMDYHKWESKMEIYRRLANRY